MRTNLFPNPYSKHAAINRSEFQQEQKTNVTTHFLRIAAEEEDDQTNTAATCLLYYM